LLLSVHETSVTARPGPPAGPRPIDLGLHVSMPPKLVPQ
jgi:hypothetical protein